MKKLSCVVILFILLTQAYAQYPGSRSLLHTQTGRTLTKGGLEFHTDMNFYTKLGDYIGTTPPQGFNTVNYWLVAGNITGTYGLFDNMDLTVALRLYQDTHYSNDYNVPDDIFVNLKAGSFAFGRRKFYGAGMFKLRFGTGEVHNYPFAEYASGSWEYGVMSAFSYYADPYLPERKFSTHLNLGWYTHNDAGKVVYERGNVQQKASWNATELQYALGFKYPVGALDFMLELHGVYYTNEPDTMVYSRENWTYVTPSIRYKAYQWLYLDLGMDIRISPDENTTRGVSDVSQNLDLPNYSAWKVQMGLHFKILPLALASRTPEEIERDRFNQRVDFFQSIIEDRTRVENIQEQLDKLKRERQQTEKELEELKQVLEEEGQK